jgi:coenzyme F420 hydrogenase subunit beta
MNKTQAVNVPNVIRHVVNNDLCTGCGVCTNACPTKSIEMKWSDTGFLIPELNNEPCDSNGSCLTVCPFDPTTDDLKKNEDYLSNIYVSNNESLKNNKIGSYTKTYAGHSNNYRLTSSSGGVTSMIFQILLENDIIDKIICVDSDSENNYSYRIINSLKEIKKTSKTKYYPTTLADCIEEVKVTNSRYAIVGLPCFIKGLRLLTQNNTILKDRIKFAISIVCGGLKSKFFTEYLVEKSGLSHKDFSNPMYRKKILEKKASRYQFNAQTKDLEVTKSLNMWELGDMWGTGLFKANACDFCDDVTGETADISIGDAWIKPFIDDGRGANIIIVRSKIAQNIINLGIDNKQLQIQEIDSEDIINSQDASFRHRQDSIGLRVLLNKFKGKVTPTKRYNFKISSISSLLTQLIRRKTRAKSIELWFKSKDASIFEREMYKYRYILKILSKFRKYRNFYRTKKFKTLIKKFK